MAKIKFQNIPDNEKILIFQQIADAKNMTPFAVEKDWWVVQTLSVIYQLDVAEKLVFKGGTSLSKAWNLIERFSEDIDFAIDMTFFGYKGELNRKAGEKVRKAAGKYVDEIFFNDLKQSFAARGFADLKIELDEEAESDKDRVIYVYYPNLFQSTKYSLPRVKIEIGSRSLRAPLSIQTFASLVDGAYPNSDFAQDPIHVPTVNPERTFLEKIFLLHEEFQRPPEKRRVERLSRHLYDILKLSKTDYAARALENKELYRTIVEHRYYFNRMGSVNYNLHQPQAINFIPPSHIIEEWKDDYNTMLEEMIYEEKPPTFDELISGLTALKNKINALEWRLDIEFPNLK